MKKSILFLLMVLMMSAVLFACGDEEDEAVRKPSKDRVNSVDEDDDKLPDKNKLPGAKDSPSMSKKEMQKSVDEVLDLLYDNKKADIVVMGPAAAGAFYATERWFTREYDKDEREYVEAEVKDVFLLEDKKMLKLAKSVLGNELLTSDEWSDLKAIAVGSWKWTEYRDAMEEARPALREESGSSAEFSASQSSSKSLASSDYYIADIAFVYIKDEWKVIMDEDFATVAFNVYWACQLEDNYCGTYEVKEVGAIASHKYEDYLDRKDSISESWKSFADDKSYGSEPWNIKVSVDLDEEDFYLTLELSGEGKSKTYTYTLVGIDEGTGEVILTTGRKDEAVAVPDGEKVYEFVDYDVVRMPIVGEKSITLTLASEKFEGQRLYFYFEFEK